MAKYCEDVLGELLLKQPLPDCPVSNFDQIFSSCYQIK